MEEKLHRIALNKTYDDGIELEPHQMYWYEQGLIDGYEYAEKHKLRILCFIFHKFIGKLKKVMKTFGRFKKKS